MACSPFMSFVIAIIINNTVIETLSVCRVDHHLRTVVKAKSIKAKSITVVDVKTKSI